MITPTNQLLLDAIRAVNILTQEVTQRLQSAASALSFTTTQVLTAIQQSQALTNLGLFAAPISVPSASAVDLGAVASIRVAITGSASISSLGTAARGVTRKVRFDGAVTLVHSSGLALVSANNIVAAAGDTAEFESMGAGAWRMTWYQRASGLPLVAPSIPADTINTTFSSMTEEQALTALKSLTLKASALGVNGATLAAGKSYTVDTTAAAITMNLPISAVVGDQIELNNHLGSWKSKHLTITCPSSARINGVLEPLICDHEIGGITLKCTAVASGVAYWQVRL